MYILPYDMASVSAKALASKLNVKRITGNRPLKKNAVVINWGNSSASPHNRWNDVFVVNEPDAVARASNKMITFSTLTSRGVLTVPWTISESYAQSWRESEGIVVARTKLTSSQGDGIIIITSMDTWTSAPLYTKYIPKCHEYRVHVAFGNVIDYSKKKRRLDAEVNEYIRNHTNNWVFCRDGVLLPDKVKQISVSAIDALGLDFGALDVLYKESIDKAWVLEVNTAPGLEGTTLERYTNIFKGVIDG